MLIPDIRAVDVATYVVARIAKGAVPTLRRGRTPGCGVEVRNPGPRWSPCVGKSAKVQSTSC